MGKEFKQTLKIFMEDYEGFDWKNGKVVLVVGNCPHICVGAWKYLLEKYSDSTIRRFTHDENTMVITL